MIESIHFYNFHNFMITKTVCIAFYMGIKLNKLFNVVEINILIQKLENPLLFSFSFLLVKYFSVDFDNGTTPNPMETVSVDLVVFIKH